MAGSFHVTFSDVSLAPETEKRNSNGRAITREAGVQMNSEARTNKFTVRRIAFAVCLNSIEENTSSVFLNSRLYCVVSG